MTDYTWNNPFSGNWDQPGNWSPYGVPSSNDDAAVEGSVRTTLNVTGNDSIYDLQLYNPNATLNISGQLTVYDEIYQDGSNVTLGRGGDLVNYGYYEIANNKGIGQTGASAITNEGVFEKVGGAGDSVISGRFQNDGEIYVGSGELEFKYDVVGGNGSASIGSSDILQFDRSAFLSSLDFSSNSTLALNNPSGFSGTLYDFNPGDTIELLGRWSKTAYYSNGSQTFLNLEYNGFSADFTFNGYDPGIRVRTGAITTVTRV